MSKVPKGASDAAPLCNDGEDLSPCCMQNDADYEKSI